MHKVKFLSSSLTLIKINFALLSLFENEIMSYVPPSAASSRVSAAAEAGGQGSPQGTGG